MDIAGWLHDHCTLRLTLRMRNPSKFKLPSRQPAYFCQIAIDTTSLVSLPVRLVFIVSAASSLPVLAVAVVVWERITTTASDATGSAQASMAVGTVRPGQVPHNGYGVP